ncbi:MAG TPA: site-2 protease family protein [Tepidisphaeraceae bacterium]|jgi:Zn-dependent protease|nr:site-2 protease family protein [Tepidisphaeraceae bacterium]
MSWRDREYNQSKYSGGTGNSLLWILTGSVPLFRAFGIRVRLHASLILFIVLTVLFGGTSGYFLSDRLITMGALFLIVLLHEFGHCFAARTVGGNAEEIIMTPLGGLAMAHAPRNPWATFVTVAGGPLVNVLICAICAGILYWNGSILAPTNPFHLMAPFYLTEVTRWVWWIYATSYAILMFNLLPIFPLDGGQLMQSVLWPRMGYYRSMLFACNTGLVGAAALGILGLVGNNLLLVFIAISCALTCFQMRMALREMDPHELNDAQNFAYNLRSEDAPRRRKLSRRSIKRAQKRAAEEQAEQARIDSILEKVSAQGMHSLTWWEKRALRKATERQRQRDLEVSRLRD